MQLDAEVKGADNNNTGFILQMDANVWAGPDLLPGDPNVQNSNGKLFEEFMQRNSNLYLVNSLQLCEGLFILHLVARTLVLTLIDLLNQEKKTSSPKTFNF